MEEFAHCLKCFEDIKGKKYHLVYELMLFCVNVVYDLITDEWRPLYETGRANLSGITSTIINSQVSLRMGIEHGVEIILETECNKTDKFEQ